MSSRSADTARRDVRRLAFARLISLAGTDASAIAVSFTLYAQTGSTRWLSASLLVMFGLGSVVAPLAGWLADRADRLTLMIAADVAAAGVFATLVLVHSPAALLGLSVLATVAGTVHGPAAGAAIPAVAGEQHLSWANGLLATGGTIGQMAGRLGGGLLVAVFGAGGVFALDAVTFLASAALVWSVRDALRAAPTADRRIRSRAVDGEGWRALAGNRTLRLVIGSSCIATLMTSFTMTAEAPLAAAFGAGVLLAGSVVGAVGPQATYAFVGIGVVVSAIPVARLVLLEAQERPTAASAPAPAPA